MPGMQRKQQRTRWPAPGEELVQNSCWAADDHLAGWYRLGHDGECADGDVVGDVDIPEHGTPTTEVHAVADARNTGIVLVATALIPDRHSVAEHAVVPNNSTDIDDNGVRMPYLKPLPYCDLGRQLNTEYGRQNQPIWDLVEIVEKRISPAQKLGDAKRNHDESCVGPAGVGLPILQDPFFERRIPF